jgi:hypothetical protein
MHGRKHVTLRTDGCAQQLLCKIERATLDAPMLRIPRGRAGGPGAMLKRRYARVGILADVLDSAGMFALALRRAVGSQHSGSRMELLRARCGLQWVAQGGGSGIRRQNRGSPGLSRETTENPARCRAGFGQVRALPHIVAPAAVLRHGGRYEKTCAS